MSRRVAEPSCPQAADHTPNAPCTSEEAERLYRTHDQVRCEGCGRYEIWVPRPAGMLAPCFACGEPERVDVALLGDGDPLECGDCRAKREAAAEHRAAGVEPDPAAADLAAAYRDADARMAAAGRELDAQRERKNAVARDLVDALGGTVDRAAPLLGVSEIRVHNHMAAANGVLHGMAVLDEGIPFDPWGNRNRECDERGD